MTTQPEPYAVYVLKCENPSSVSNIEQRAERHIGMAPSWVYAALNHWERYYVGMSGKEWSLRKRLKDHILGTERAANFTKVFHPEELVDVDWYQSRPEAAKGEVRKAIEYRRKDDDWFVYQH